MLGKNLKIIGKSLFKFSSYSHPEIWEFQGVTQSSLVKDNNAKQCYSLLIL
jgi:hypothetical protein